MSPQSPLPTDPDAWGACLCAVPAPILADTAEQLTELALLEERCGNVDAHRDRSLPDALRGTGQRRCIARGAGPALPQ